MMIKEPLYSIKESLYLRLGLIKDDNIRNFTEQALNYADEEFWTYPSSLSGRYHPKENNGIGGLVRHTIKTIDIAKGLGEFMLYGNTSRDITIAGAMLHDIKKGGDDWFNYPAIHGLLAYEWLKDLEYKGPIDELIKEDILNCVRYHMRQFSEPKSEAVRAVNATDTEQIVQIADHISSRKELSFLPGLELSDKIIKSYLR
jgi:hypothetical protein